MAVRVAQVLTIPLSVRAYAIASTSSTLHLTNEGWYKSGALSASTLCGHHYLASRSALAALTAFGIKAQAKLAWKSGRA